MPAHNQAKLVTPPQAAAPAATEPPPRRLRVHAVGGLLRATLAPLSQKQGVQLAHILPFWPSICPLLHAHGTPESLRGGTLTICTPTSSAQREFMFLAPSIIEGANRVLGYEAVSQIRCMVRGQAPHTQAAKLAAPLPPSSAATDKATHICQTVPQDDLRAALVKLGSWVLKR